MPHKLFVGGLSWNTDEETLAAHFAQFGGKVVEAKIILDRETNRPRGFGFVTMDTEADADRVKQELNGGELDGRSLTINDARERERSGGGGGGGGRGGRGGPRAGGGGYGGGGGGGYGGGRH